MPSDHQKPAKVYLLTISAIFATFLLSHFASTAELAVTPISEVDETKLGDIVRVQGEIVKVAKYNNSAKIVLKEGDSEIDIYFPPFADFEKNTRVGLCADATGEVERYEGEVEIVVESARDVRFYVC